MSNFKKHMPLILMAFLILVIMPMSFAADIDNNATADVVGIDDSSSEIVEISGDSDVLRDDAEGFIEFENTDIEINEGDTAVINGVAYWYEGAECYDEVHFQYNYVDSDGITKTGTVTHSVDYSSEGFTLNINGLKARDSPYIVSFTPVEDDDWDTFEMYSGGMDPNKPTSVSITVKALAPGYDYETSVSPSVVEDYVIGESCNVSVSAIHGDFGDMESDVTVWQVYVNGADTGFKTSVDAMTDSFLFDLADIADLLVEGNNTIVFHPNQGTLESWAYYTTFKYNNLTVVATKPVVPGYDYETSVSPSVVEDYVIGESCNVSVSAIHGDFGDMESDVTVWQVYVNGADTGFKTSVDAMTDSFLFDLADIADLLVEGNNTIVFHPNQGTLESWAYYTTFKYNNLTVVATKPVSIYTGIIYVDATNGNDDNNGSSDRPVATISKAIELASSENNNEHKIIISEGTYIEHDLNITSALDISANGNVVIDAQELGRIFDIKADTNITGITFKNGKSDNGGAISIKDAKVSIDNSLFENNEASSYGSAIYWNANDGVLTNTKFTNNTGRNGVVSLGVFSWSTGATGKRTLIDNCIFDDNHNVEYGNCIGLDVTGSDVTVKNTNFTNNIGEYGSEHGALYIKGDDVVVDNCLFENNAMGMAAAIQIDGENALINNSIFINNTVSGYPARSGAIEVQNAATITNNIFIANGGEECIQGGAIDVVYNVYGGDVIISNNQFFNNSAKNGGAIFVDGGSQDMAEFDSLTISENVFDGDSAENGAGIYTENSDVEVTIINNEFNRLSAKSGSCVYSDGVELGVSGNTVKECTSEDGNTMSNEYADTYGDFPVNPTIEISTNNPAFGENATITVKLPGSSTANVVITVDNNVVADTNLDNGVLTVTVSNLSVGNHSVVVTFAGDANYTDGTNQTTLTVSKANISVDDALTITVPKGNNSAIFTINLPSDANGTLNVTVDGKSYVENVTNGTASITVDNLASGVHNISVIYSGDDNYEGANKNTSITIEGTDAAKQNDVTPAKPAAPATTTSVTPAATKIVAKNKTFKAKKKIKKYSITLKTKAGKPVAKVKVTLKVKGKTYIAKTNAKGKVVFKLKKLTKKGTYKAKISFKGNSLYKASSKTVKIIIKK